MQTDQTDHLTEVKGIFEVIRRTDYKISNLNGPLYYSGQIDSQLLGDIMRAVPSLVDFLLVADQEYVEDFVRVLLPFATYYRQGGHNHLALKVVSDFHLSPFATVILGMGKYGNACSRCSLSLLLFSLSLSLRRLCADLKRERVVKT